MVLYEFYGEMRGKRLAQKWDKMKRYDEEPTDLYEYGGKLKNDLLVVDIDDMDHADILTEIVEKENINCIIRRTTRGKHFYFKNTNYRSNRSQTQCAIGLTIEIKVGNNKTLNPIKVKGEKREIEKECDQLDKIPLFLKPISKKYPIMANMGSDRNNTLRDIQIPLSKRGIMYEEYLKIATIINNYVFDIPLYEKFGFNENGVLRKDLYPEVQPEFFIEGKFQHVTFAEYMKKKYHLCNINDVLHIYKDGVYVADDKEIKRKMLKLVPTLKRYQRKEILKYLEITAERKKIEKAEFIPFKNCILNIKTNEIFEHSPKRVFKNILNVNYNPNLQIDVIDNMLNNISVGNQEIKRLIKEMIGYTMYRRNELGKAFILVGDGSNGKSTLLSMIKGILGNRNIAALDIKELDERFKTWKLYGKLANLGDDISSRYINDSSFFKKLATGDLVTAERKGKDAFEFSNYATMIYSANKLPKTSDKSDGFYRRFTPVPLNAKFSKQNNNFDLEIVDRLKEDKSLEYLAYISLKAFKKVLNRQAFTKPLVVKEMIERYKIQNSNVLLFLDDYESDLKKTYLTELYLAYQTWCKESGHKHCSKGEFKSEIYDYGYEPSDTAKRINGKVKKYFVEVKK